jgi:hypothetical protein
MSVRKFAVKPVASPLSRSNKKVTGCNVKRINRIHNPGGLGSGNCLLRLYSVVSWCTVEMGVDTSNRLLMLAVAEIPFDVRQNK